MKPFDYDAQRARILSWLREVEAGTLPAEKADQYIHEELLKTARATVNRNQKHIDLANAVLKAAANEDIVVDLENDPITCKWAEVLVGRLEINVSQASHHEEESE